MVTSTLFIKNLMLLGGSHICHRRHLPKRLSIAVTLTARIPIEELILRLTLGFKLGRSALLGIIRSNLESRNLTEQSKQEQEQTRRP